MFAAITEGLSATDEHTRHSAHVT